MSLIREEGKVRKDKVKRKLNIKDLDSCGVEEKIKGKYKKNRANWPTKFFPELRSHHKSRKTQFHLSEYDDMKIVPVLLLNSKYKHAYLNFRETALTWLASFSCVVGLHSFLSIRMSIWKSQDHLFSMCHFPAQKPSVVLHDLYGKNPILWPGLFRKTQHTVRDKQPGIVYRAWLLTSYAWADLQVVLTF